MAVQRLCVLRGTCILIEIQMSSYLERYPLLITVQLRDENKKEMLIDCYIIHAHTRTLALTHNPHTLTHTDTH